MTRKLRVFLCHASEDKPAVRELYKRLAAEPWIEPWLDEESLLPGQDFDLEIYKATRDADAIIVCLSKVSVAKEGYVNKEIRRALDIANEKPEGMIYVIPLRLDECNPSFEYLKKLHWVDYFTPNAHEKLVRSLRVRADALEIEILEKATGAPKSRSADVDLDLFRFVQIPPTEEAPYSFRIGKYPVTNAQYERFINASDYATESYWCNFLKFNEDCVQIGRWKNEGWDWLKKLKSWEWSKRPTFPEPALPAYWNNEKVGISNPENPVVGISWYEANAYCNWLLQNWSELIESRANSMLRPRIIRLPLDTEWKVAAGGEIPFDRYPWDFPGEATSDEKEIARRSNLPVNPPERKIKKYNTGYTTPVNAYLRGVSPHGVMDMAGNCLEWQANYENMEKGTLGLHGGTVYVGMQVGQVPSVRDEDFGFIYGENYYGFRMVLIPGE